MIADFHKITEYLVVISENKQPERFFTGICSNASDGAHTILTLHTSHSRIQEETAQFAAFNHAPVGVLSAPYRFPRSKHIAMQAYRIAQKFHTGKVIFFDSITNNTEYQTKYH